MIDVALDLGESSMAMSIIKKCGVDFLSPVHGSHTALLSVSLDATHSQSSLLLCPRSSHVAPLLYSRLLLVKVSLRRRTGFRGTTKRRAAEARDNRSSRKNSKTAKTAALESRYLFYSGNSKCNRSSFETLTKKSEEKSTRQKLRSRLLKYLTFKCIPKIAILHPVEFLH